MPACGDTAAWNGNVTLSANSGIYVQGYSTFTIGGSISGNFQSEFYADAYGTLALTPTAGVQNSYGSTKISGAGVIIAGNQYALSTGGLLMNGGTLRSNGFNFSFANLSGASGQIQNSGTATSTLTIGSDNTSTSYGGTLANGGTMNLGLVKTGSGILTLSGANSYGGGTIVDGGTVQVGNATALGSGGLTANAGVVDLAGFTPTVLSLSGSTGVVTNNGAANAGLIVNQASTTTFAGSLLDGVKTLALTKGGADRSPLPARITTAAAPPSTAATCSSTTARLPGRGRCGDQCRRRASMRPAP